MRRILLLLFVFLVSFPVTAATHYATSSQDWSDATWSTTDCDTPDTQTKPVSGDTVHICDGATVAVDENTADVTLVVDAGGTLTVSTAGYVLLSGDSTISGTVILTGTLAVCLTGTAVGTCTVNGQTATSYPLDTWTDYDVLTAGAHPDFRIVRAGTDAAMGSLVADDQILWWGDIDGDPSNDSKAARLRPFFFLDSVNNSSGTYGIDITYGVGNGSGAETPIFNERSEVVTFAPNDFDDNGNYGVASSVGVADGIPDMLVPAGGVCTADSSAACSATAECTAGVGGTCTRTEDSDRTTQWTAAAGTLLNDRNGDMSGMVLTRAADGADGNTYTIGYSIDSALASGGAYDRIFTWSAHKAADLLATAQQGSITWGEGQGSLNESKGDGPREFLTFTPAQIVATDPAISITIASGGTLTANFAIFGAQDGASGFAPIIYNAGTLTENMTWHVGGSADAAGATCNQPFIRYDNGSLGSLTDVQVSHVFEPITGLLCTDPDDASGMHGIGFYGSANPTMTRVHPFSLGKDCYFDKPPDAAVNQRYKDCSCGWIHGLAANALGMGSRASATEDIDGFFMADAPAIHGLCSGDYSVECQTNSPDCDAHGGTCSLGSTPIFTVGTMNIKNVAAFGMVISAAVFAHNDIGSLGISIDGGFVFDPRPSVYTGTSQPMIFNAIGSVKHFTSPRTSNIGKVVQTFVSNFFPDVKSINGPYSNGKLLMFGDGSSAYNVDVEDNAVRYDDSLNRQALSFSGLGTGSTAKIERNLFYDEIPSTEDAVEFDTFFDDPTNGEFAKLNHNVVIGWAELVQCAVAFDKANADAEYVGNLFSWGPSNGGGYGQLVNSRCTPDIGVTNKKNFVDTYADILASAFGRYTVYGRIGPQGVVGYCPNSWTERNGVETTCLKIFGSGGGGSSPWPSAKWPVQ